MSARKRIFRSSSALLQVPTGVATRGTILTRDDILGERELGVHGTHHFLTEPHSLRGRMLSDPLMINSVTAARRVVAEGTQRARQAAESRAQLPTSSSFVSPLASVDVIHSGVLALGALAAHDEPILIAAASYGRTAGAFPRALLANADNTDALIALLDRVSSSTSSFNLDTITYSMLRLILCRDLYAVSECDGDTVDVDSNVVAASRSVMRAALLSCEAVVGDPFSSHNHSCHSHETLSAVEDGAEPVDDDGSAEVGVFPRLADISSGLSSSFGSPQPHDLGQRQAAGAPPSAANAFPPSDAFPLPQREYSADALSDLRVEEWSGRTPSPSFVSRTFVRGLRALGRGSWPRVEESQQSGGAVDCGAVKDVSLSFPTAHPSGSLEQTKSRRKSELGGSHDVVTLAVALRRTNMPDAQPEWTRQTPTRTSGKRKRGTVGGPMKSSKSSESRSGATATVNAQGHAPNGEGLRMEEIPQFPEFVSWHAMYDEGGGGSRLASGVFGGSLLPEEAALREEGLPVHYGPGVVFAGQTGMQPYLTPDTGGGGMVGSTKRGAARVAPWAVSWAASYVGVKDFNGVVPSSMAGGAPQGGRRTRTRPLYSFREGELPRRPDVEDLESAFGVQLGPGGDGRRTDAIRTPLSHSATRSLAYSFDDGGISVGSEDSFHMAETSSLDSGGGRQHSPSNGVSPFDVTASHRGSSVVGSVAPRQPLDEGRPVLSASSWSAAPTLFVAAVDVVGGAVAAVGDSLLHAVSALHLNGGGTPVPLPVSIAGDIISAFAQCVPQSSASFTQWHPDVLVQASCVMVVVDEALTSTIRQLQQSVEADGGRVAPSPRGASASEMVGCLSVTSGGGVLQRKDVSVVAAAASAAVAGLLRTASVHGTPEVSAACVGQSLSDRYLTFCTQTRASLRVCLQHALRSLHSLSRMYESQRDPGGSFATRRGGPATALPPAVVRWDVAVACASVVGSSFGYLASPELPVEKAFSTYTSLSVYAWLCAQAVRVSLPSCGGWGGDEDSLSAQRFTASASPLLCSEVDALDCGVVDGLLERSTVTTTTSPISAAAVAATFATASYSRFLGGCARQSTSYSASWSREASGAAEDISYVTSVAFGTLAASIPVVPVRLLVKVASSLVVLFTHLSPSLLDGSLLRSGRRYSDSIAHALSAALSQRLLQPVVAELSAEEAVVVGGAVAAPNLLDHPSLRLSDGEAASTPLSKSVPSASPSAVEHTARAIVAFAACLPPHRPTSSASSSHRQCAEVDIWPCDVTSVTAPFTLHPTIMAASALLSVSLVANSIVPTTLPIGSSVRLAAASAVAAFRVLNHTAPSLSPLQLVPLLRGASQALCEAAASIASLSKASHTPTRSRRTRKVSAPRKTPRLPPLSLKGPRRRGRCMIASVMIGLGLRFALLARQADRSQASGMAGATPLRGNRAAKRARKVADACLGCFRGPRLGTIRLRPARSRRVALWLRSCVRSQVSPLAYRGNGPSASTGGVRDRGVSLPLPEPPAPAVAPTRLPYANTFVAVSRHGKAGVRRLDARQRPAEPSPAQRNGPPPSSTWSPLIRPAV